jgi:hypothetical protein
MKEQQHEQQPPQEQIDFIDYLIRNMPVTARGINKPGQSPFGIPDKLFEILYDIVAQLGLEESAVFSKLRDKVTPGKIESLPISDFLSNLCINDEAIYEFDSMPWQEKPNERKLIVNQPTIEQLNNAKLNFIIYLVKKIPTIEVYEDGKIVWGVPETSFNIIKEFGEEFSKQSIEEFGLDFPEYMTLCNNLSSQITVINDDEFVTRLNTQEIKSLYSANEDFMVHCIDCGQISAKHLNLIEEGFDLLNVKSEIFDNLTYNIALGNIQVVDDYNGF